MKIAGRCEDIQIRHSFLNCDEYKLSSFKIPLNAPKPIITEKLFEHCYFSANILECYDGSNINNADVIFKPFKFMYFKCEFNQSWNELIENIKPDDLTSYKNYIEQYFELRMRIYKELYNLVKHG